MTDDAQSLAERCGTSVHATDALLTILQEQKIKHATALSFFCTASARAAMAQSSESQSDESIDKSLGVMDCGASITITRSLLNWVNVKEHKNKNWDSKERRIHSGYTCVPQDLFWEEPGWCYGFHHSIGNIRQRICPRLNSWKITQSGEDLKNPGWGSGWQWTIPIEWGARERGKVPRFDFIH